MKTPETNFAFVLYAIDADLLYPCVGARFETNDLAELRRILSIDEADNPGFDGIYTLDPDEVTSLCNAFNIPFDSEQRLVTLHRDSRKWHQTPYLFHSGYELPLLLQGRKKLAKMFFGDMHDSWELKARYDHYVAEGLLYVEEEDVGASPQGDRMISALYTPTGEEWRIAALKQVSHCAGASGGWNEHYERLEGTLMGYEDWQNDWWLKHNADGDGVMFGMSLRGAVTKAGLEWIVHAGNRALPPVDGSVFIVFPSYVLDADAMQIALRDNPHIEAFVQFNIAGRYLMHVADLRTAGPFALPASLIPDINRKLTRPVRIVTRRNVIAAESDRSGV